MLNSFVHGATAACNIHISKITIKMKRTLNCKMLEFFCPSCKYILISIGHNYELLCCFVKIVLLLQRRQIYTIYTLSTT